MWIDKQIVYKILHDIPLTPEEEKQREKYVLYHRMKKLEKEKENNKDTTMVVNIAIDPTDTTWFPCTRADLSGPSPAEEIIIAFLELYNIPWHREVSFNGLRFNSWSHPRYDFYIPSIKTVIEYDGIAHHSKPDQIAKDKAKDKFCIDNGLTIIRWNKVHYPRLGAFIKDLMDEYRIKMKKRK